MKLPWMRERVRVDLDPVQVTIVLFLLRFGTAPSSKLFGEVTVSHGCDEADFRAAITSLAEKELVDVRPQDFAETWFALSKLGKRLKGKLPVGVRTGLAVYI